MRGAEDVMGGGLIGFRRLASELDLGRVLGWFDVTWAVISVSMLGSP